jgi:hypothetical protein
MGLFLVFATSDLRAAVPTTCSSFYMPFSHLAVVSYDGSANELARRLGMDRSGGPGRLVGCLTSRRAMGVATGLVIAIVTFGVLI